MALAFIVASSLSHLSSPCIGKQQVCRLQHDRSVLLPPRGRVNSVQDRVRAVHPVRRGLSLALQLQQSCTWLVAVVGKPVKEKEKANVHEMYEDPP